MRVHPTLLGDLRVPGLPSRPAGTVDRDAHRAIRRLEVTAPSGPALARPVRSGVAPGPAAAAAPLPRVVEASAPAVAAPVAFAASAGAAPTVLTVAEAPEGAAVPELVPLDRGAVGVSVEAPDAVWIIAAVALVAAGGFVLWRRSRAAA